MRSVSLKSIAGLMQLDSVSLQPVHRVEVDSRQVKPGTLFFALPGLKCDGHDFLKSAVENGAAGAVVHSGYRGSSYGVPLIYSEDVLVSLQTLAREKLAESKCKIVAITGSVGKTTTKEFIVSLLKSKYKASASPGNSNSQIGLPLSIINEINLNDDIVVLEMGMTNPGQIARLIQIAPPLVAVITQIALVHAANFSCVEEIAKAKAEIFGHHLTQMCIYHKESDFDILSLSKSPNLSYSTDSSEADFFLQCRGKAMEIKVRNGASFALPLFHLPGDHNRLNYLAAIAVARYFGVEPTEIAHAQQNLTLPERRLQIIEKNGAIFINDSYNACEISMKAALRSLPPVRLQGKRKAVLGAMMELGAFSEQCHRQVAMCALEYVDEMYCYGIACLPIVECWKKAGKFIMWAEERKGIVEALRNNLNQGDVILLKGSRSQEAWRVLDDLFLL